MYKIGDTGLAFIGDAFEEEAGEAFDATDDEGSPPGEVRPTDDPPGMALRSGTTVE